MSVTWYLRGRLSHMVSQGVAQNARHSTHLQILVLTFPIFGCLIRLFSLILPIPRLNKWCSPYLEMKEAKVPRLNELNFWVRLAKGNMTWWMYCKGKWKRRSPERHGWTAFDLALDAGHKAVFKLYFLKSSFMYRNNIRPFLRTTSFLNGSWTKARGTTVPRT